jgi:phosphohistidine phosphatase
MHTLYLIRHAIAEERGPEWPDDRERPLTKDGAARMRQQVQGLANLDVQVTVVLTSPLVRTRQTADIVSAGLPGQPPVELLEALAPGGTPARTLRALVPVASHELMAIVGHEPDLGLLAAHLIGAQAPLPFKKGAICCVDVRLPLKRPGQLRWFATPRILRGLA